MQCPREAKAAQTCIYHRNGAGAALRSDFNGYRVPYSGVTDRTVTVSGPGPGNHELGGDGPDPGAGGAAMIE
eukprot:748511-Hanusia_phi.AAC.1